MNIAIAYQKYLQTFERPHNDFHLNIIRVFIGLFFCWKLLSRDFSFMGTLPHDFFYFYPYEIYRPEGYMLITGMPILMEFITFHWVHWILGFPTEQTLSIIVFISTTLMFCLVIFGRGPYFCIAILSYTVALYLWGFIFLSGQDIDSIMLYFGMLLVICIVDYRDVPIWRLGTLLKQPPNIQAGRAFSAIIMVFVVYYGLSGINKMVDINILEWFQYGLIKNIEQTLKMQKLGNYYGTPWPDFFSMLSGQYWINYIAVPLVYLSHISIPIIFFRRDMIPKYAAFYTTFHLFTFGVSIAFTGYTFVWLVLLNHKAMIERAKGFLSPRAS